MATNWKTTLKDLNAKQVKEAKQFLADLEKEALVTQKTEAVEAIKKIYAEAKTAGVEFSASDFSFLVKVKSATKSAKSANSEPSIPRYIRTYKGKVYAVTRGKVHPDLAELSPEKLEELKKPNPEHPDNQPKKPK